MLQKAGFVYDGIILNAGGYTHTSVAIADAVKAIRTPVVEVHVSNIFARERSAMFRCCHRTRGGLSPDLASIPTVWRSKAF